MVSAAETVWNEAADRLQQLAAGPGRREAAARRHQRRGARPGARRAETDQAQLRDQLNSDPLALWQHGQVDASRLDRLREQTAAAVAAAAQLAALRDDADRRIATVTATVTTARAAYQDALTARDRFADQDRRRGARTA